MSSLSSSSALPTGSSLLGGFPLKGQDLAASIVFLALYALLAPLAVWRLAVKDTRHVILIRPLVVLVARLATFAIRAAEVTGHESEGLLITEQVLLYLGLIPLASTLLALVHDHVDRTWVPSPSAPRRKTGLNRLLRLLNLALVVAVVLAIVLASEISDALSDPGETGQLKRYRYAVIGLTLGVTALAAVLALYETQREDLPRSPALFVLVAAGLIVIASIYRLVTTISPPSVSSRDAKAAFYLLSALPEWLCVAVLLGANLERLFAVQEGAWKDKVAKKMRKGTWEGPYVGREGAGPVELRGMRREEDEEDKL
ncbi:hypothetical protein JCM9279_001292 [Rhodotorula babjevae]